MSGKLKRNFTNPAMIVAMVALFVALGGASYAAVKLPKNSVGSKQLKKKAVINSKIRNGAVTANKVKADSLTGAQINESTLGTVPNAANVDRLAPFGVVSLAGGQVADLVSYGPFKLTARCDVNGANLEARVVFSTTEDGTGFGGDDASGGSVGPGTAESSREIEDPGASSSGAAVHSDGYDDQFSAIAPSGASWFGSVQSLANKDANSCKWSGYITKAS